MVEPKDLIGVVQDKTPAQLRENVQETVTGLIDGIRIGIKNALIDIREENAYFRAKIIKGHRIVIPIGDMESLGLTDGAIVQVLLWKDQSSE